MISLQEVHQASIGGGETVMGHVVNRTAADKFTRLFR